MRFVAILVLLAQAIVVNNAEAQPAKTQRLDRNGDPLPDGVVARLGTSRFQPPARLRAAALSPDGTTVVMALASKTGVRLDFMDTATGKSLRNYDLNHANLEEMRFTSDGKSLWFNSHFGSKLVDAGSGTILNSIKFEDAMSDSTALSPDCKWAAAQQNKFVFDAPVSVLEIKTGKEVASLPGLGASCKGLVFSPDGKRLLLWSIVPTHVKDMGMSFGPESKAALACIDIETRKIVGETKVGSAQGIALCADGETVAFEAADHQSVRIRHLPTGTERCVIPVKESRFAFTPDGKALFTSDGSGQASLWNTTTGKKLRELEGTVANQDISIVGISKDGQTIAVLDGGWHSEPLVVVWNAATGKRVTRPPSHEATVTCIAYCGTKLLASGSLDKTVRLWNPVTGEHLRILTMHQDAVTAIAFSADGKLVATSSKSGVTRLSNVADGKAVADFTGPMDGATVLAFSQEGKVLYAGGHSPEVLAWETTGAKEAVRLKAGEAGVVTSLERPERMNRRHRVCCFDLGSNLSKQRSEP